MMLTGLALVLPACGGPIGPDPVPSQAARPAEAVRLAAPIQNALTPQRVQATFPLVDGSFALTLRGPNGNSGTVAGHYSGNATVAIPGRASAELDIQITERTGLGSPVIALDAEGDGAFVDEGNFTLAVSIVLSGPTPQSDRTLRTRLRGTTQISCSATERILVTQRGTGSAPGLGDIVAELHHEVGNTSCSS